MKKTDLLLVGALLGGAYLINKSLSPISRFMDTWSGAGNLFDQFLGSYSGTKTGIQVWTNNISSKVNSLLSGGGAR